MGAHLDAPVKDKNTEIGENDEFQWAACAMQGWRINMEDAHIIHEVQLADGAKGLLVGVFDGHGGEDVAHYARQHFLAIFMAQLKGDVGTNGDAGTAETTTDATSTATVDYKEALTAAFMQIDKQIE